MAASRCQLRKFLFTIAYKLYPATSGVILCCAKRLRSDSDARMCASDARLHALGVQWYACNVLWFTIEVLPYTFDVRLYTSDVSRCTLQLRCFSSLLQATTYKVQARSLEAKRFGSNHKND